MAVLTKDLIKKNLKDPDEIRTLPKTRIELFHLGDRTLMRAILEPGWRWSEHIKPKMGTEFCTAEHLGYLVSGRMALRMSDGKELEYGAGDLVCIPPNHEAWVVGNEEAVFFDFLGGETYKEVGR